MALAKDPMPNDHTLATIQATTAYYGNNFVESPFHPSAELYGIDEPKKPMFQESEKSGIFAKNFTMCNSSSVSSPSSSNSNGLGYQVINFKPDLYGNCMQRSGSLLVFEQKVSDQQDGFSVWEDNLQHNYQNQLNPKCTTTDHGGNYGGSPESGGQFGWLTTEENAQTNNGFDQEIGRQETGPSKRPITAGENAQANKKQCTISSSVGTKSKPKPKSTPAKDPQSIAAKNRRERISERLKILQDLVPNGSKVDLVTMLEKAISYVKFLQLQVKVLATDEFWPAQGGKAPELSQVKEAIDAILASQIDRNSASNDA